LLLIHRGRDDTGAGRGIQGAAGAREAVYSRHHKVDRSVGTGDEIERIIRELRPDIDVAVVSNPEFLREGAAIHDFKHPIGSSLEPMTSARGHS